MMDNFIIEGVHITHPDRIIKSTGILKKQLVAYYHSVSDLILPYLINRPLVLYRCPEESDCFFQKHHTKAFDKSVYSIDIREEGKEKKAPYLMIKNKRGLIALIQFGTVEFHAWGSNVKSIEKPDQITFDLDPDISVPWKQVVDTAFLLKDIFEQLNLKSFVKTSGGKGLHVVIPVKPTQRFDEVKSFAHAIALFLQNAYPNQYTDNPLKAKRKGKIFIDYLRNGRGATTVAAYSARAKKDAPISTPLSWDELPRIKSASQFTIANIKKRLGRLATDPWEDFFHCSQRIPKKLKI